MDRSYQICTKCIMDTTDPDINFDENGICDHCTKYETLVKKTILGDTDRKSKLEGIIKKIKKEGENSQYDSIVGVSGGVDSTYTAYKAIELGLRPLAVHLDNGWNSELAVSNIEKVLDKLEIDLYTKVLDWEEFKDLQLAFLRASTPDSEIPTDHAIIGLLHKLANKMKIKYIILGNNFATEAIMPKRWSYGHMDWRYIRNIQKKFGNRKLMDFPHYSLSKLIYYRLIKKIRMVSLLNYFDYNKDEAKKILQEKLKWCDYEGKHYESIYTRFFQGYILSEKFGYDKRRAHLSTLINSGQITREEALESVKKDPYPSEELKNEDKEFVIKKLEITTQEFERIMKLLHKTYWDYPSYQSNPILKMLIRAYLWKKYG